LGLIVVGMLLLALDLAIAGLGLPTAGGTVALTAGSWWLFASDHPAMQLSPWLIALVVLTSVIFFVFVMTVVLRAQAGPEVGEVGEDLVGKVGVVRSTMNPEGHVFVGGALWRARWVGDDPGKVKTGTRVRIVANEDATLLVDDPDRPTPPPDGDGEDAERQPVAGRGSN
jgi:membrane-bound serine protease (ClpP class)